MHFALVVTYPAMDFFALLSPTLRHYCHVDILPAESNTHAYQIYKENCRKYDAFVFTGKILLYAITSREPELECPCFTFEDESSDIRDLVIRLVMENRDFDFSRVFVDIANSYNDYLGLHDLLPPDQWPYTIDDVFSKPITPTGDYVDEFIDEVYEKHHKLHKEGKIDLSITRFGSIVPRLDQLNYSNIYLLPSREYVINYFIELSAGMKTSALRNQLIGAMVIDFPKSEMGNVEDAIATAGVLVEEYALRNGHDFAVSKEKDALRVLTRFSDLEKLTGDFSNFGFRKYFLPEDSLACIGLGTGHTMFQASRNAFAALEITQNDPGKVYYISEDNTVAGPIGQEAPLYRRQPDDHLIHLAEKYRVDHVYLQKIIAYARLCETNVLTAEELASFLGVTTRTANRVLSKILSEGGAVVYEENPSGKRGRPQKYYDLTFISQLQDDGLEIG